jgi:hypothetical protein
METSFYEKSYKINVYVKYLERYTVEGESPVTKIYLSLLSLFLSSTGHD